MLRLAFVLVILNAGLVGAVRSRFGALLLYIWFALFRPMDWSWIDISALRPSLLIGLILVVPCILTGVFPVVSHVLGIGALVFLGSAFVAQIGATNQAIGWYWLDFLSKLILVCLFTIRLTSTRWRFTVLIAVIAFSFGIYPINSGLWFLLIPGGVRRFDGIGGAFADNNGFAVGVVMILPFMIATAQNAPWRWLRGIAAASIPLSALAVISTFSRGGLLALGAAILTYVLLQRRKFLILICAAAGFPVLLWMTPIPSGYMERMSTIQTYSEVDSARGRLHFWEVALRMAADRPLGIGLWNFQSDYDRYDFLDGRFGRRRALHNSHLQALAETGWIGGAAWIALFVSAFTITLRVRRQSFSNRSDARFLFTMSNAIVTSMAAFLVGGSFVSLALNDLTWLTFALVASLERIANAASTEEEEAGVATVTHTVPLTVSTWQPPMRG